MAGASFEVSDFGTTKYGEKASIITLRGAGGTVMEVSDYGGKIIKIYTADRDGNMKDVVVGFDDPSGWDDGDPYWGCIIGRYANRIANGKFTLGGVEYSIPTNNAPGGIPCGLHGGTRGWDAYVWAAEPFVDGDIVGVVFKRTSPDGENGFPGTVEAKVTYTLGADNVWRVDYEAKSDKDTPLNMTQHVYFNFKGEAGGTIEDHELKIAASNFLPTDAGQIPTGEVRPVAGGPFDFRGGMRIGERINEPDEQLETGKGYDHCWVLDEAPGAPAAVRYAATLSCPLNGRKVDVYTSETCMQVYTANWASYDQKAKGGEHLSFRCGIALETQHAPDSPNRPEFPTTVLKAGETYLSATEFRFGVM
ncbi:MAG: galactose mutarotase [Kiritimatiellae bacterium]|nr:galactose mutarotase [Kiritimatiellia bacterium]